MKHSSPLLSTRSANAEEHGAALSPRTRDFHIGDLDIHCDYLQLGLVVAGEHVSWDGHVHNYLHSIEHALGRERSDGCSREKVLSSISLGRDLAMECMGNFA